MAEGSRYTLVHQMYSKPADTYTVRHGLEHDVLTKDASRSTGPEYRVAAGTASRPSAPTCSPANAPTAAA